MEELIKLYKWKGDRVVNARELHDFLESKRQYIDWIKQRIEQYGFIKDQDYMVFHKFVKNSKRGRPRTEYAISIDMAKELAMIENNNKGKQARKYFIEMEKIARQTKIAIPSKKELAKKLIEVSNMVIEAEEKLELTQKELKEKEPLFNYAETVKRANDTILVRQLAKHISNSGNIKVGQNRLFKWFREQGYLNEKNEPYQEYVDMGLFGFHETQVGKPDKIFTRRTTTITGKGRVYFTHKYIKDH